MSVELTMVQSLNEALRRCMREDPRVLVMGEDVGALGGVFRVTDGLLREFGDERVLDTPLNESGIIGTAIGLAIYGFRPVCEIQFDAFSYPAFEQIASHLGKYRFRTRSEIPLPIVVRIPYGGGIGAVEHHSESPEAHFAHTPGLKVVTPSTPAEAYALLVQAVEDPDPVIFLEPKRRYWSRGAVDLQAEPERGSAVPIGRARVVRRGRDVTLIAYGPTVRTAEEAADGAAEEGVSCEVIDLRWLNPLDVETLVASVRRTGRAVVVAEAPLTGGVAGEVAARVTEAAFTSLESPVLRVCGYDIPYPPAKLERFHLPDVDRVLDAVFEALAI